MTIKTTNRTDAETWSHLQETVKMLQLAVAQIEASILDSEKSFDRLAGNFTAIITTAQSAPDLLSQIELLKNRLQDLQSDVQNAVMDFQFFDRLAQRLSHVKESLKELGEVLTDTTRIHLPTIWSDLQNNLKSRYTMQCEREMFDMMLAGASVEDALTHFRENYLKEKAQQSASGDIDLF
jgi:chaperonin cofactor prefoldin